MSDLCPYGFNGPTSTGGDHCYHRSKDKTFCCWCGRKLGDGPTTQLHAQLLGEHGKYKSAPDLQHPKTAKEKKNDK